MSQALAQSATLLAESTPKEINLRDIVVRNATKSIKGVTRERLMLNSSKLMQLCRDEYKSRRSIEKVNRLPDEVEDALQAEVNKFVLENVNRINPGNCLTFRSFDYHDFRNLRITNRLTAVGEDNIGLQAQLEGCRRIQRVINDRLEKLEKLDASGNSHKDYTEQIKSCREQLNKLDLTEQHVKATLAQHAKSTQETK